MIPDMRAAIYARKSTDQSHVADDGKSVVRQVEHGRAYAVGKGWTVAAGHVYVDDGISGAEFAKRPGFVRLMNALKPAPAFDVLVMSEESRLGREAIETAYALKQLITAGVRVFFYLENRERTLENPTEKVLLSLTTFADELEREKARQRTYDALARKAKAGHVTGGRVFGYDNVPVCLPDGRRSHVERRINESEALVVRRIFQLCADGFGKATIAKRLNAEGAACPRAQRGRPNGWAPSSVFAVLARPLYRGEIVWNRSRKRDQWGVTRHQPRPQDEWLHVAAPELRIVSAELCQAVDARQKSSRTTYLQTTSGKVWGRPRGNRESKYLLPGLARCGLCGAGLKVVSRAHGSVGRRRKEREYFYVCQGYQMRGPRICKNGLQVRMADVDAEVIAGVDESLQPRVIERVVARVLEWADGYSDDGLEIEAERLSAEITRLTDAIAGGGDLPSLRAGILDRQRRLDGIQADTRQVRAAKLSSRRLEQQLRVQLADWRGLLLKETASARGLLRRLLREPLTFTPVLEEPRRVTFEGRIALDRMLAGLIDLPLRVASPTGFEPVF